MRRSYLAVQLRHGSDADDGASEIAGYKRYARRQYYGQCPFCKYPSVCYVQFYGKSRGCGGDRRRVRSSYSHAVYARNHSAMGARKPHRSYRRTARA